MEMTDCRLTITDLVELNEVIQSKFDDSFCDNISIVEVIISNSNIVNHWIAINKTHTAKDRLPTEQELHDFEAKMRKEFSNIFIDELPDRLSDKDRPRHHLILKDKKKVIKR